MTTTIAQLRLNIHTRRHLAMLGMDSPIDVLCALSPVELLRNFHLHQSDIAQIVSELARHGRSLHQPAEQHAHDYAARPGSANIFAEMNVRLADDELDTIGIDLQLEGGRVAHLDLLEALRLEAAEAEQHMRSQRLRWTAMDLRRIADVVDRLAVEIPDAE